MQQLGEGIENITGIAPFAGDDTVDSRGKSFKSAFNRQMVYGYIFPFFKKRRVAGKSHVYNPLAFFSGAFGKGRNEALVIVYVINLPDNVIASSQMVNNCVQAGPSGADNGLENLLKHNSLIPKLGFPIFEGLIFI